VERESEVSENHPRFWSRNFWKSDSNVSYVLLAIGGVALYVLVQLPGDATTSGTLAWTITRARVWKSALPIATLLLNGVAMAMITVSIFELLKEGVARFLYRRSTRREFDEFFGEKASSSEHKGVIVLQSDQIDKI
jgi:hypothetical protein